LDRFGTRTLIDVNSDSEIKCRRLAKAAAIDRQVSSLILDSTAVFSFRLQETCVTDTKGTTFDYDGAPINAFRCLE
jgi:hypothetical protein